ncbi:MAG: DUF350 domain-containing protein [Planctomycetia bacterium]|nr:DUF350 domain-containing protein [Planctomycetia bacterium]
MRHLSLGPHTFLSPQPHPRHHEWLAHFTPRQRRQMIEDDHRARLTAIGIMVGAVLLGMSVLIAATLASH